MNYLLMWWDLLFILCKPMPNLLQIANDLNIDVVDLLLNLKMYVK